MKRNIAAVVLAAGSSSRMGTPKQLLRLGSRTLLGHSVAQAIASSVRATFVVIGANAEQVRGELCQVGVTLVENARFAEGIGTSIAAGMGGIEREQPPFDAVVLLTCDQPNVSVHLIDELIEEHARSAAPLVACSYAGTLGIPALFAHRYFVELRELPPKQGAKQILLRDRDHVAAVHFEPAATDLDTPADYKKFTGDRGAIS